MADDQSGGPSLQGGARSSQQVAEGRLRVSLVSPEKVLYEGDAEMVVARAEGGEIAFLPGHVPFLGVLGVGVVRVLLPGDQEVVAAVHGGFVEVSHDRITVLSDVAELAGTIDEIRARTAQEAAEARLHEHPDDEDAKAALARAELRLQVAGGATASPATH
jgi:F-type H+-transporting ATPase subunit epsilon